MKKKRKILVLLAGLCVILGLISRYVAVEFNIDLLQTLTGANTLTAAERQWLKQHGTIIYGADQNSPPLRFVDRASGQYQGIVVDYIRALSIELETQIEFKPLVWSEALTELARGNTDICDMFPSQERGRDYLFTDPIYNMRGLILVPNGRKDLTRPGQLTGLRVAAPKGDYVIGHLNARVPSIRFITPPDMFEAMVLLKQGRADAVAGDEPVISHFLDILEMKSDFHFMEAPLYELGNVLGVSRSKPMLHRILNKGINTLNNRRIIAKIQQKWFGISTPLIQKTDSEKLILLSLVFLTMIGMIIYLFTAWNHLLRTEVEKRTSQLEESRTSLQTTFDSLSHFMVVLDPALRILNVNASFCNYTGIPRDRIIGRHAGDTGPVLNTPLVRQMIEKTAQGSLPKRMEFELDHQIYEIRTFSLMGQGSDRGNILCMIMDLTVEKENEKQMLYANKMSTVGRLAAGVTHEIRNPLGLIRNHCYLLKKKLSPDDPGCQRSIKGIETAVTQSNRIIDNLLNFSRISGNQVEKVNVGTVLERMIALQSKALSKKQTTIRISCPDDLEGYINQEALGLVIINLLSNALDALEPGGLCEIRARRSGSMLDLTCRDTGKGIAPGIVEQIFDPFFTTKPRGAGTGLGLYIAYNQALKLGGEIRVKSRPGKGTSFYLAVPLRTTPPKREVS